MERALDGETLRGLVEGAVDVTFFDVVVVDRIVRVGVVMDSTDA